MGLAWPAVLAFGLLSHIGPLGLAWSDVKSTSGSIGFDVQRNGSNEMILNSTGLGIGTSPSSNLQVQGNTLISETLNIGGTGGSANLNVHGSLSFGVSSLSSSANLTTNSYVLVDTSVDNVALFLPYAGNATGRQYTIKKTSNLNKIWIAGGGNLIDHRSCIELSATAQTLPSMKLLSDGQQWYISNSNATITEIASDNLVGWWTFDEEAGITANDSSNLSHNGTLVNGFTFSGNRSTGKYNHSLSFDGIDDHVNLGTITELPAAAKERTISFWFKTNAFSNASDQCALSISSGAPGRSIVFYPRDQAMRVGFDSVSYTTPTGVLATNQWHHIVLVIPSGAAHTSDAKVYLNGEQPSLTTSGTNQALNTPSQDIYVGSKNNSTMYFNGSIDDLRFFDRALSDIEVRALYGSSP